MSLDRMDRQEVVEDAVEMAEEPTLATYVKEAMAEKAALVETGMLEETEAPL